MAHHSRDGEPGGTSRRSFLQTGAAAALAGGTLASLLTASIAGMFFGAVG